MFPIQKWTDIQPKCTIHIDFDKMEYTVHFTDSPEAELQLIGLTPGERNARIVNHDETTIPVQRGRAFGFYAECLPITLRSIQNKHEDHTYSRYIRTGVYDSNLRIMDGCHRRAGKIWITFGGPVTVKRMLNLLTIGRGVTFAAADGTIYNTPLSESEKRWGYGKNSYTINEGVGGVPTSEALLIMHVADSGMTDPSARDEDQIEGD